MIGGWIPGNSSQVFQNTKEEYGRISVNVIEWL